MVLEPGRLWKTVISDSWRMAEYLRQQFPQRPSWAGEQKDLSAGVFVDRWTDAVLLPALASL